ncbi:unnamed protein product [Merluccius merluccius]
MGSVLPFVHGPADRDPVAMGVASPWAVSDGVVSAESPRERARVVRVALCPHVVFYVSGATGSVGPRVSRTVGTCR